MEIHELNTKALTDPAYVPFDDGTDTYKAEFNEVVENAANAAVAEADLTNNPVAFTSGDAASPTAWSDVSVITTGSTLATLFNRISTMVKNVRWLYSKLGTTDISSIGGGTVTGAISALNGKTSTKVGVFTPASGCTASEDKVYQYGNVCFVNFYVTKATAFGGSEVNIGAISGIALPSTHVRFQCASGTAAYNAVRCGYALINTNGNINVLLSSSNDTAVVICVSYTVR